MPDARALHCPNCGAPAEPEAGRCPFCKARLATVSCPECFALIFDGTAFCPECGAARSRASFTEGTLRCPGCAAMLQRVDVGRAVLQECAECDGVWMDADRFEALCADKEAQGAVLHRYDRRAGVVETAVTYRKCPRCEKMMNRVNFARLSGTIVDVCRGHGTFLDRGELHQLAVFLRDGGMDRARQRQIDDLREKERSLKELERREGSAYRSSSLTHGASSGAGGWSAGAVFELMDLIKGE